VERHRKFDIIFPVILSFGMSWCCGVNLSMASLAYVGDFSMALFALGGVITGLILGLVAYHYKAPWWLTVIEAFYSFIVGALLATITAANLILPSPYSPFIFAGLVIFFSVAVGCLPTWAYTATHRLNHRDLQNPQ
jgi:hypothetical protein